MGDVAKDDEKKIKGNGSYADPYVKRDGTPMVKWSLTVPRSFVLKMKAFSASMELGETVSSFVVRAVDEEMKREIARQKELGTWKSVEEVFDV